MRWIRSITILIILLSSTLMAQQVVTVQATGFGMNFSQAKKDALRNAVEQGAGVKIFSETVVEDFVALKDVMVSESFGLVTGYTIISKTQLGKQEWEVRVSATVSKEIGKNWAKMKVILEQKGRPTIMFCLKETLDGTERPDSSGEYQLVQKFKDLGFPVIDRQSIQEAKELQKQIYDLDGNQDGIVAVASKHGADLLVSGTLEGNFVRMADWFGGVQGIVYGYNFRTKVVRTDTSQVIGSLSENYQTNPEEYNTMLYTPQTAGKAGFTEVIRSKYVEPMIADILNTWIKDAQDGTDTILTISGAKFSHKKPIMNVLENLPDLISSVQHDHYRNKRHTIRLKSKLTTEELADELDGLEFVLKVRRQPKNFYIEVVELTKNKLEVAMVADE